MREVELRTRLLYALFLFLLALLAAFSPLGDQHTWRAAARQTVIHGVAAVLGE